LNFSDAIGDLEIKVQGKSSEPSDRYAVGL